MTPIAGHLVGEHGAALPTDTSPLDGQAQQYFVDPDEGHREASLAF